MPLRLATGGLINLKDKLIIKSIYSIQTSNCSADRNPMLYCTILPKILSDNYKIINLINLVVWIYKIRI